MIITHTQFLFCNETI